MKKNETLRRKINRDIPKRIVHLVTLTGTFGDQREHVECNKQQNEWSPLIFGAVAEFC